MATTTVKKGDTLSAIAKANGVTLAQLLELNPNKKKNPNLIVIGENLNIPESSAAAGTSNGSSSQSPSPVVKTSSSSGSSSGSTTKSDPYKTAAAMGYTVDDFANDPNFLSYWSTQPSTSLVKALQGRNDYDSTTGQKKVANSGNTGTYITADTAIISADDFNLYKFSSDPTPNDDTSDSSTVWLMDNKTKTLTPFANSTAYTNWLAQYGVTPDEVLKSGKLYTADPSILLPGSNLNPDGSLKISHSNDAIPTSGIVPGPDVDTNAVSQKYGKTTDLDTENLSMQALFGTSGTGGLINVAKEDGIITADTASKIIGNAALLHKYINAFTYGGYTAQDILQDMKRQQAVANGDTTASGLKVIDESQTADIYKATADGKAVTNNASLTLPGNVGGLSVDMWNYKVGMMPQEAYDVLVKPFDWNSDEGKALMAGVKTSYYDIMMQRLEATTEQEKYAADYAYKQLQDKMDKNFGIQLSDDANTAWTQLNSLNSNMESRGLNNSGMAEEQIDSYLKGVRKTDQLAREQHLTDEEQAKYEKLHNSGTPEEIAALSDADKVKYGFKPSAEQAAYFTLANLQAQFPDVPKERLQQYIDGTMDANGNYRSTLYSTMFSNKLDLQKQKADYQMGTVTYDKDGNVTGGYGAIFQKAMDDQNQRNYLKLNPNYYGDNPNISQTQKDADVAAAKTTADAKLKSEQDAAALKISQTQTTQTSYTPAAGEVAPFSNESTTQTPKSTTGTKSSVKDATHTLLAYDADNNNAVIYVQPGVYTPGASLNKPTVNNQAAADAAAAAARLGSGSTNSNNSNTTNSNNNSTSGSSSSTKTGYQGSSIVDYLSSTGKDSSYTSRTNLAKQYGISNYSGTAAQNTQLLKTLRGY